MSIWQYPTGSVMVELKSASTAQALTAANVEGIVISDIQFVDMLTVRFEVARGDLRQLRALAEKRGDLLKILTRNGYYWTVKGLLKRPVMLAGMLLLTFLTLYLPTRVLFVAVSGNQNVSAQKILEKAADCGIEFGASRREVRSEKMKNRLLGAVPELKWAGVNTYGCLAVISVTERAERASDSTQADFGNIVADRDGVIREITVLNGTALCKPGQAVTKGQTLISGYMDLGIAIKGTRADGEIIADTERVIQASAVSAEFQRGEQISTELRYGLILGKKLINFYKDSGISDASCVRMYLQYPLVLPGGFRLPFSVTVEKVETYKLEQVSNANSLDYSWMEDAAAEYLRSNLLAGEIRNVASTCTRFGNGCRYNGVYKCREMIGRFHSEELVQKHG